jgi:hypothetical protein
VDPLPVIFAVSCCTPLPNGAEHDSVPKFSAAVVDDLVATSATLQLTFRVPAVDVAGAFVVVVGVVVVDVGVVEAAWVRPVATPSAARTPAQPASTGLGQRLSRFMSHHLPLLAQQGKGSSPARGILVDAV